MLSINGGINRTKSNPRYAFKGARRPGGKEKVMNRIVKGKSTDTGMWVYGWYCEYTFGRWPLKPAIIPAREARQGHIEIVQVDPTTVSDVREEEAYL